MRVASPMPTWPQPLRYPRLGQGVEIAGAALSAGRTGAGFATGSYGFSTTSQALSTTGALVSTAGAVAAIAPTLIGMAAIPYVGWVAAAVGVLLEIAGSMGLFAGKPSVYAPKRAAAAAEATSELNALGRAMQTAANQYAQSGDPAVALTALQTKFGSRNPVRSFLMVPIAVAQQIGIHTREPGPFPGQYSGVDNPGATGAIVQYGTNIGAPYTNMVVLQWDSITATQFARFLALYAADPKTMAGYVLGSGDVAYLPQAQAEAVAGSAAGQSQQYLLWLAQHLPGSTAAGGGTTSALDPSFVAQWVTQAYQKLLGRAPSSQELGTGVSALLARQLTAPQFLTMLTSSPEFHAAYGATVGVTPTGSTVITSAPTGLAPTSTYWWQNALLTPQGTLVEGQLPRGTPTVAAAPAAAPSTLADAIALHPWLTGAGVLIIGSLIIAATASPRGRRRR